MTNKQFFYGRVSTKEQNADRQIKAAKDFGIDDRDIYIDKKSGKDFDREQYQMTRLSPNGEILFPWVVILLFWTCLFWIHVIQTVG